MINSETLKLPQSYDNVIWTTSQIVAVNSDSHGNSSQCWLCWYLLVLKNVKDIRTSKIVYYMLTQKLDVPISSLLIMKVAFSYYKYRQITGTLSKTLHFLIIVTATSLLTIQSYTYQNWKINWSILPTCNGQVIHSIIIWMNIYMEVFKSWQRGKDARYSATLSCYLSNNLIRTIITTSCRACYWCWYLSWRCQLFFRGQKWGTLIIVCLD